MNRTTMPATAADRRQGIGRRRAIGGALGALAAGSMGSGNAFAQAWPGKPVRFICGYAAGGLTDIFARLTADYLQQKLGQPFVVENRTGAGSMIAGEMVARSAPDGYTIWFTNSTAMFQNQVIFKTVPYDVAKDFTPVAMLSAGKSPVCVHKSVPGNSLAEFVAYARNNKVSWGTTGPGSTGHIFCAKINELYGLQIEPVHYRGEAPMWTDFGSGVVQIANSTYQGALPHLQAGNIKPIAVPTKTRMVKKLPDVKTFWEQGATHPYFLLETMVCCLAPAGTPRDIVEKLSAGMVETNDTPRVQQVIDQFGNDTGIQGWQDFEAFIRDMGPNLTNAVKELGIKPE